MSDCAEGWNNKIITFDAEINIIDLRVKVLSELYGEGDNFTYSDQSIHKHNTPCQMQDAFDLVRRLLA